MRHVDQACGGSRIRHPRYAAQPGGDVGGERPVKHAPRGSGARLRCTHERQQAAPAERTRAAGRLGDIAQPGVSAVGDADALGTARAAHGVDEWGRCAHRLEIDEETRVGKGVEQGVEALDRLTANPDGAQFLPREISHARVDPGRSRERRVVKGERNTVLRHLDIGLEQAQAEGVRHLERGEGVLGREAGAAPVGDRDVGEAHVLTVADVVSDTQGASPRVRRTLLDPSARCNVPSDRRGRRARGESDGSAALGVARVLREVAVEHLALGPLGHGLHE